VDERQVPDLHEALERTAHTTTDPEDYPPPPADWVSHPVTRLVLALILLGIVAGIVIKWSVWLAYIHEHPFGAGLTGFILLAIIGMITFSYWRFRTMGDLADRYWDTKRKIKPR